MLSVFYELADPDELPLGPNGRRTAVDIQEDRGRILFRLANDLTPGEMVQALNVGAEAVIRGGHWFQEWKGEILAWAGSLQRRPGLMLAVHDTDAPGAA